MGKSSSKLSAESWERLKQHTDANGSINALQQTNLDQPSTSPMPSTTATTSMISSPLGEKELMELRKGFSHDHLTDAQLLNMLANEQSLAQVLTEIFHREVELSDCMQTLLRGNCLASKIMSHCFRKYGSTYLRQLLRPHIRPLMTAHEQPSASVPLSASVDHLFNSDKETSASTARETLKQTASFSPTHKIASQLSTAYNNVESIIYGTNTMQLEKEKHEPKHKTSSFHKDISYEIDSTRLEEDGDIGTNQRNLLKLTKQILDSILASVNEFPPQLNSMCICLRQVLCSKFPDADANLKAVGTVIFLRYINPAIVAPFEAGIVEQPPSQRTMRGLMLVSKILQNIANNVEFSKEEHMLPFNDFVREQFEPMRKWVSEISSERSNTNKEPNATKTEIGYGARETDIS